MRFSAGTLALEGGVPFGVAATSPVTFTVAQPRRGRQGLAAHVPASLDLLGKTFQLRVHLSLEHFANGLQVSAIDRDEQQENAGRFCAYLGPELGKRCQPPTAVTAARCDSRGVRNQRARRRQRASGSEQQPAQRLQSPLA
jgi:hypothetical protein